MGIQINGQTDTISATDGSFTISGASGNLTGDLTGNVTGNVTGNLTGTASTATAAATAYGLSGSPNLNVGILTATSFSGSGSGLTGVGKILQVVNAVYGTATSNDTSTYADTGLSATITPSDTSSKILILVNQSGITKQNNTALALRLLRNTTTIITFEEQGAYTATTTENSVGSSSVCYLDSPATTSAVTYKTQFASLFNNNRVYVQGSSGDSTITLLEVAA